MGFLGSNSGKEKPKYTSHIGGKPAGTCLLLGAGASKPAKTPLMKEFIDRGRDAFHLDQYDETESAIIKKALGAYERLRRECTITELDVENIETILSVLDMEKTLGLEAEVSEFRKFITLLITKSTRLPAPMEASWLSEGTGQLTMTKIIRAIAELGDTASIVTTNYDCNIEYICHCLGLPFTYDRAQAPGVEIIKLHGSTNWMYCDNEKCVSINETVISPLRFELVDEIPYRNGYIKPTLSLCPKCKQPLSTRIIPPTWDKTIHEKQLESAWHSAAKAISNAECFVAIGHSLPESDSHLRQLIHIALKSNQLRQSVIVCGRDEVAAARWTDLFRTSWRNHRLAVYTENIEACDQVFQNAFGTTKYHQQDDIYAGELLPVPYGMNPTKKYGEVLESAYDIVGVKKYSFLWNVIASRYRRKKHGLPLDKELDEKGLNAARILEKANLIYEPQDDFSVSTPF